MRQQLWEQREIVGLSAGYAIARIKDGNYFAAALALAIGVVTVALSLAVGRKGRA
jgi:hypothetical protein